MAYFEQLMAFRVNFIWSFFISLMSLPGADLREGGEIFFAVFALSHHFRPFQAVTLQCV